MLYFIKNILETFDVLQLSIKIIYASQVNIKISWDMI